MDDIVDGEHDPGVRRNTQSLLGGALAGQKKLGEEKAAASSSNPEKEPVKP